MHKRMIRGLLVILTLLLVGTVAVADTAEPPDDETLVAVVAYVADEREIEVLGYPRVVQHLELVVRSGPRADELLEVEHHIETYAGQVPFQVGDLVYVTETIIEGTEPAYYVVGYVRWPRLGFLVVALVALVVLIARDRGALALLGMVFSFAVIFVLVLPRLAEGREPVTSALLGAAVTMPVSYYLAHGFNRKTTVALVGSLVGLVLTGLMAVVAVEVAQLSGYASEEVGLLRVMRPEVVDVRGLLLAGMIVSMLGVLDDITVAQAAVVEQLHRANPSFTWQQLYQRAMQVGQDHIASMVNTLVLVFAGAALPLLLLMSDQNMSPFYALSLEPVSEEIVRMLVTSCGMVATVPICTALAALATHRRRHRLPTTQ
jgi:uncharacterized membrane protein